MSAVASKDQSKVNGLVELVQFLRKYFGCEDLNKIRTTLVDFRDSHLPKGVLLGYVEHPLKEYVSGGCGGWYAYTQLCFENRLPILAYTYNAYSKMQIEAVLELDHTKMQQFTSKLGCYEKVLHQSRWWYRAFLEVRAYLKQHGDRVLARGDYALLKTLLNKIWISDRYEALKKYTAYNAYQKKSYTLRTFPSDDFERVWKDWCRYFMQENVCSAGGDDLFDAGDLGCSGSLLLSSSHENGGDMGCTVLSGGNIFHDLTDTLPCGESASLAEAEETLQEAPSQENALKRRKLL